MKRPRPPLRQKKRPRTRRKESRRVSDARTRVAIEHVPMKFTKKRKWVPAQTQDGAERAPSWSRHRSRTRSVEEVREAVRRELSETEGTEETER